MTNCLLIFPPGGNIFYPHLSLPILAGQLKGYGFPTKCLDLNIEFTNDILSKKYMRYSLNLIKRIYLKYKDNENELYNSHNENLKKQYLKAKYVYKNADKFNNIPNDIEKALKIWKSPTSVDDICLLYNALQIINDAEYIATLPFYPFRLNHFLLKYNYEELKKNIFDKNTNFYLNYYKKKFKNFDFNKYEYIGISIGVPSQLIPGFTLSNFLKKKTNSHINIGGSHITGIIQCIMEQKDIFDTFADSFSYGEGEKSIIEIARYLNDEIPIEKVSRLVYKKDGKIIYNLPGEQVVMNEIEIPDFSDYDFKKYPSTISVLPIQIHRGCKWGKCSFCNISTEKTQSEIDVDKLINQLKYYKTKYGIEYFEIVDEAVYPEFLENFTTKLIKEKLNLKFKMDCRFEKGFNYKLFKKMRKSGVIFISWGFESANERICKLINKGVNIQNRLKILKAADKAGIYNHLYIILNFPTETYKEAMETYNFIVDNNDVVLSSCRHLFTLQQNSLIAKNPKAFRIKINPNNYDFYSILSYTQECGMSNNELLNMNLKYSNLEKNNYFLPLDFTMYYIAQHGLEAYKAKKKQYQKDKSSQTLTSD